MISANGGLPAHRYTPQVTPRWPRGSEPASADIGWGRGGVRPVGATGPSVPSAQSWYACTGRVSTPNPAVGQGTLSGRKNSHPRGALAYLLASASLSHHPATAMLAMAAPNARMAAAPPRLQACHPMDSHPVAASKPWIAA